MRKSAADHASRAQLYGNAGLAFVLGFLGAIFHLSTFFPMIGAMLLINLGKLCLELRRSANAFRADTKAINLGQRPSALVAHVEWKKARRDKENEPGQIALWLAMTAVLIGILWMLPIKVSAAIIVWMTLGELAYIFFCCVRKSYLAAEFNKAIASKKRPGTVA
jgi:hypothetical protein